MEMTAGNVYNNLNGWNWDALGKYSLKKPEADAVMDAIRRNKPKMAIQSNKGEYYSCKCPNCKTIVAIRSNFCIECGQKLSWIARVNDDFSSIGENL